MHDTALAAALELTAAMHAAADGDAWDAVAMLASQRHVHLEAALRGDAWHQAPDVVGSLRRILAIDQQLAMRATAARQQTALALTELRSASRMQDAYTAHGAAG